jgi:hypothetical protein
MDGKGEPMKVAVEFKAPQTIEGLKMIVEQWETQFPQAKAVGICAYGTFALTLEMPPATQVIPPQLVDMTGTVE